MEPTKAILWIDELDSQPIPFVSLVLDQYLFEHHRVEIKIDLKQIGPNVLDSPMQKTSMINTTFQLDIQQGSDAGNAYGFLGLITDVQVKLDEGDHGWLYVYGASRSIELERGKMLQTFSDTDLRSIVAEVTQGLVYLEMTNQPEYASDIKFSMQYNETDYQYLKRLAWQYNEKFFFSGDSLVFGKFDEKGTAKVTYDMELKEVSLNSRLIPNKFVQYYHNLQEEKKENNYDISQPGTFTGDASAQADILNISKKPNVPIETPVFSEGDLKKLTEMRAKTNFNRMFYVSGRSKLYKVRIGCLLEVDFHKKMVVDEKPGALRVTRVKHVFDEQGRYENYFEACQTIYDNFPYPDIELPNAQPIEATVVFNEDPDGLGKVQLQFDFEKKTCSHWFRCIVPDGGGNGRIGEERNRGFICVPEIKDRVLVAFMQGNPDKPFVMGSLFHGGNASVKHQGGGAGNHIRSLSDKANNFVQLNSQAGVKIQDKAGNYIHEDGKNFIELSANDHIKVTNGKCVIEILGNNIDITAVEQFTVKVGNSKLTMTTDDVKLATSSSIDISASKNHIAGETKMDGGNVFVN